MLFLRSAALAVTVALASVAQADYSINITAVPLSTRQSWCSSELSTCPIICEQLSTQPVEVNTCDATTLTYGCLCGNNQQPNISEYTLTLPYFICQEYGNQCVAACGQNNQCSSNCRQDNPCGATNPQRYNTTSTSTSTATSAATASETSGDIIYTGTPGGGSSSAKGAAPALDIGRTYGLFIVLGSMFVGFAML